MGPLQRLHIFILFAAFLCIHAASASHNAEDTNYCDSTYINPSVLDCTSPSSSDYYGIGVRLGVYFTWFASWVANLFVPDEVTGALDSNTIFLLALVVSVIHGSSNSTLTHIDGK
jgi:hypothetical protein